MNAAIKFLLLCAFLFGAWWCYQQGAIENAKGVEAVGDKMVIYWGGLILCSVGVAVLVAFTFLPKIGEWMAGVFYSAPSEQIEKGPHSEALAKIAVGDYEGAVRAYEKAIEKDPEDVYALVEISKLQIDRLGNPAAAAARLETALEKEWPKEKVGPLMFRLADIYWKALDDANRARLLLEQIIELLPDTTHAANAGARLREIEQAERDREEAAFLAGNAATPEPDVEFETAAPGPGEMVADNPNNPAQENNPARPA